MDNFRLYLRNRFRENSREKIAAAAALVLVIGFWSIFYPELTLTGDSYRKVGTEETMDIAADYHAILNADRGEVEIRFSFWDFDRK